MFLVIHIEKLINMQMHTLACRDPQLVMLSSNFWDIAAMMVRATVE